jgi:lipid II:glycine glycyltransferase (peptidoglycan interpeptide bridge formation enzyme)
MQAVFKFELDNVEIENIRSFCNSVEYCSIEQSIGWTQMFFKSKICYFYLIENSVIKSFCQINENYKFAHVVFGPVCCDKELMITSIKEIILYYKKRRFYFLDIQMYFKSGFDTEYIEYALNKNYNIKYIFDKENTKSSLEINLDDSDEEIFKRFRASNRGNIKKAIKLGLTVEIVKSTSELTSFIEIYLKMCTVRNLDKNGWSSDKINEIHNYLISNNKGQILIARDKDNIILGGVIMVYQGNTVRYFLGASDPDRRDLPVLHAVIYEAIKQAKNANFKFFDFWGYNHFVDENDQVYHINEFKAGFGGYFTFFAKKMNIDLVPFGSKIYSILLILRKFKNSFF